MNPIARYLLSHEQKLLKDSTPEELWHKVLTGTHPMLVRGRPLFKRIPSDPRCQLCQAPFRGPGALLMRLLG
ncbi:MAG TPA: hypothetical protein VJ436_03780, partial [Anaerolineales bacterium]|nr:hypothetical protein [Anaerolineales bacterium]